MALRSAQLLLAALALALALHLAFVVSFGEATLRALLILKDVSTRTAAVDVVFGLGVARRGD